VRARHLRRLWALPGTLLGVSGSPARLDERVFGPFNYWWQAHVLDCLVDAYVRSPDYRRRSEIERFTNGIRVRNARNWLNDYYDDMAWLALAMQRAEKYAGVRRAAAVPSLARQIRSAWTEHGGGGIWWRSRERHHEDFKNVPANGPAAILLARLADPADRERARSTVDWIEEHLVDMATGLVYDGLHVRDDGSVRGVETTIYTYCQGVFIGACIELATKDEADKTGNGAVWAQRAARTIAAVSEHVTIPDDGGEYQPSQVLRGQGGGDGGLFAGILARYLALAATALPSIGAEYAAAGEVAAELVYSSAEAAWRNRAIIPTGRPVSGPLFGPDWTKPAELPKRDGPAERDLSVQVGAWMLLEAAAVLERAGVTPPSSS